MRPLHIPRLLTGCAVLALTAPASAQEPPIVVIAPAEPAQEAEDAAPVQAEAGAPAEEPSTAGGAREPWSPVPVDEEGRSAYGLYLSGRVAGFRGAREDAAAFLALSHALSPDQPDVGEEAFRSALFTGDLETVVRLSPWVREAPLLAEAGRLFEVVIALQREEGAAALARLTEREFPAPYTSVGRYLLPSVAAAAGDWDLALQPAAAAPEGAGRLILPLQRAQLLEHRRRYDEADAAYLSLLADPDAARLFAVDYARFLERRGRREEALARYRASLTGPSPDPQALEGLERAARRGRPPQAPGTLDIAARALTFAALEAADHDLHELSAIYLRLSEALSPSDTTTLQLGLALASAEQEEPARAAFLRVGAGNPIVFAGAQFNLGLSLRRAGAQAEALAAFRRADAAAPGQTRLALELAAQLLAMDQPAAALDILKSPALDTADQQPATRFLRGSALEALGRIDEAEAELWTALQSQPSNPMMLNYLGYLWVDSGRRVAQGAEMIARAHAADPQNGNIQDSLGWAQYRQGLYEEAVGTLEGAVEKEPANAEINDHLGDAYWRVGRRREAEWQWNRVLTLEPDPQRRAEVERKLARGLDEPGADERGGAD